MLAERERFEPRFMTVAVERLEPSRQTVRSSEPLRNQEIVELAQSLKELGLPLHNLVVRHGRKQNTFEVVCGERRLKAARIAGLENIPVVLIDVANDEEVRQLQLIENIHRRELTPLELARALKFFIDPQDVGESVKKICRLLKKSRSWVNRVLGIPDKLTKKAAEELERWPVPLSMLYEISLLPPDKQLEFIRRVKTEDLSVPKARSVIKQEALKPKTEKGDRRKRGEYRGSTTISIPLVNGEVIIKLRKSNASHNEAALALSEALRYLYRHCGVKPFIDR